MHNDVAQLTNDEFVLLLVYLRTAHITRPLILILIRLHDYLWVFASNNERRIRQFLNRVDSCGGDVG